MIACDIARDTHAKTPVAIKQSRNKKLKLVR